jgi:crotonobetainyl-CoA:carnitine CoA-transferase CaiB-like acyl-CoA transferase
MAVIGRPEWADDPRWSNIEAREQNWAQLMDAVASWTSTRVSEECLKVLSEAGVASARYRTPAEVLTDDQLAHRGAFTPVSEGDSDYLLINPPFRFSDGSVCAQGHAPWLGADRSSVLVDWLGGAD